MKKEKHITIPKPCHEDWSKMTSNQKGKHYKTCNKSVFDFTKKTDYFILKTFKENGNILEGLKTLN
ncbi:MAG: hypothetical protein QNK89_07950 [Lacinutrix sp.]|uniref:hypothetical protein n=1 Tax=Lacinutrix sp. TaxID=1937692 RepID=UPI003095E125